MFLPSQKHLTTIFEKSTKFRYLYIFYYAVSKLISKNHVVFKEHHWIIKFELW